MNEDEDEAVEHEEADYREEEGQEPKMKTLPYRPSEEEVMKHNLTHIPFRSWCPFCVKGRGTGLQHRRTKEEDRIPILGFDYLLGTHSIEADQQDEVKILAAKCQKVTRSASLRTPCQRND